MENAWAMSEEIADVNIAVQCSGKTLIPHILNSEH
jgi:hypothetical protein